MPVIKAMHIFKAQSTISQPIADATHSISNINFLIVELVLDNGLTGQGYLLAFHYSPHAIEGVLRDIQHMVVGRDCTETGALWNDWKMESEYFGNDGLQKWAYAAVNVAMWDAWAKTLGQPIHKLFGICHKRIPVYGSGGWLSYSEKELVEEVVGYKKRGFTAVKIKVGSAELEQDLSRLRKVREAVGGAIKIMMDANQGMNITTALPLASAAASIGIHWFEEPFPNTDFDAYHRLRQKTGISLAMGEREYNVQALKSLIERRALDLWQPDLLRIGGVEAWRNSASLAQCYHLPVLPHYYKDYDVPLLCGIEKAYGAESFDWIDGIIDRPMRIEDGWAYPREGSGWGFEFLKQHLTEC